MGKDKKGKNQNLSGEFKLKETLQKEDIELTRELHRTDRQYREIYGVVQKLSDTYENCKGHAPPQRYTELKDMIKMTISDNILAAVKQATQSKDPGPPKGKMAGLVLACRQLSDNAGGSLNVDGKASSSTQPQPSRQHSGKVTQLLQSSLTFNRAAGDSSDKILQLHKAELIQDVEQKKKIKDRYETKVLRLHNRLDKLKRDYAESKHLDFFRRYTALREMIKLVIRDEGLKPEDF
ncbi:hypothetical protein CHS0354_039162 [Potamilus streckersoni]|uniref:Uncharacterized protein n=1 Tax=Potamilus streckersoni TaxID=2493646 RepID=A0AAE0S7J5_9BIVA|nr:hypothetical protein CHS0354_039162 [Potamilus streckersoni]